MAGRDSFPAGLFIPVSGHRKNFGKKCVNRSNIKYDLFTYFVYYGGMEFTELNGQFFNCIRETEEIEC